jgi:predicted protein tyrosine phosphatase
MKLLVRSRQAVEELALPEEPHLVISIRTPGDPREVKLPETGKTIGVLRLEFDDLEREVPLLGWSGRPLQLFDGPMASDVFRFVGEHPEAETIVTHCDAGVSRSAAVAAALAKTLFGGDDSVWWTTKVPNRLVYRVMVNEHVNLKRRHMGPFTKFVFMDVDGVVNHFEWWERRGRVKNEMALENAMDPWAMAMVEDICIRTGAAVVVSSSTRKLHNRLEYVDVFRAAGLWTPIVGVTPDLNLDKGRGREIDAWLRERMRVTGEDVESFVILDDDSDMEPHMDRLVKTSHATGIRMTDVDKAIGVLGIPWKEGRHEDE